MARLALGLKYVLVRDLVQEKGKCGTQRYVGGVLIPEKRVAEIASL